MTCNILAARGGLSGVFNIKSGLNIKYGLRIKPSLKIKAGLKIKPGLNIKIWDIAHMCQGPYGQGPHGPSHMGQGPYGPRPTWAKAHMGQGPYGPRALPCWANTSPKNAPWKKESKLCLFVYFLETKKMRDVRTIILAAVSRRDLCYVSENKGLRLAEKKVHSCRLSFHRPPEQSTLSFHEVHTY